MANVSRSRSETPFTTVESANVQRSIFDLSHDHKTTFSMGQLIPFLTVETLPSDDFYIQTEAFFRFLPQYFPVLHRINATIDYFYVPNRILWSDENRTGWESFIAEADPDSPTTWAYFDMTEALWNAVYDAWETRITAYQAAPAAGTQPTTILDYMGLRQPQDLSATLTNGNNDIRFSALPVAAYWKIWNDYYRRPQVQDEILPTGGGLLITGNNATNWELEFNLSGAPYYSGEWLLPIHRNWNMDYFTSALPSPEAGSEVLVPMYDIDATGANGNPIYGAYKYLDGTGAEATGTAGDLRTNVGGISPTGVHHTQISGQHDPAFLDIQSQAATIKQFRLAARTQEFLEKLNRVGNRYRDVIAGFFGKDPMAGVIDYAEFLGRSESVVSIQEVMSMSEQSGSPVGDYAGKMIGGMVSQPVRYTCQEHGFIIGIVNIQPRSSYIKAAHQFWFRDDRYDYAWQEFTGIGDEAILNKEVANYYVAFTDATYADTEFGYTRRYNSYRYMHDMTSGEFATDLLDWTMARDPAKADVALNEDFLKCYPRVFDVFQMGAGTHEIFAQFWNKIIVKRPLPKFGVPYL